VYLRLITAVGLLSAGLILVAVPASSAQPFPPPTCHGLLATIVGTKGPDILVGTPGSDVILGRRGWDVIVGRGGNDVLCGGAGSDRLHGRVGHDFLIGGHGRDMVTGGTGTNDLIGGSGNDVMRTGLGGTFKAGAGDDTMHAGDGGSTFHGGPGADTMVGGDGNSKVVDGWGRSVVRLGDGDGDDADPAHSPWDKWDNWIGVAGDDSVVRSGAGGDVIITIGTRPVVHAGAGNDYIDFLAGKVFAGPGSDLIMPFQCDEHCGTGQLDLHGGGGQDIIWLDSLNAPLINADGGAGSGDELRFQVEGSSPGSAVVKLALGSRMEQPWSASLSGFEHYSSAGGTQLITGTDGRNVIDAGAWDYGEIYGLGGDDRLSGATYIDGGDGDDDCGQGQNIINCENSVAWRSNDPTSASPWQRERRILRALDQRESALFARWSRVSNGRASTTGRP
jgi:hypothetical protein